MSSQTNPAESNKKDVAPTSTAKQMPLHSNDLVDRILQLASAYNNSADADDVEKAQQSFLTDLNKAKKTGEVRAKDKMLADVMGSLAVKTGEDTRGSQEEKKKEA